MAAEAGKQPSKQGSKKANRRALNDLRAEFSGVVPGARTPRHLRDHHSFTKRANTRADELPLQAFRDARDSKGVEEARADPEAEIAAIQTLLDRIREPPKAELNEALPVVPVNGRFGTEPLYFTYKMSKTKRERIRVEVNARGALEIYGGKSFGVMQPNASNSALRGKQEGKTCVLQYDHDVQEEDDIGDDEAADLLPDEFFHVGIQGKQGQPYTLEATVKTFHKVVAREPKLMEWEKRVQEFEQNPTAKQAFEAHFKKLKRMTIFKNSTHLAVIHNIRTASRPPFLRTIDHVLGACKRLEHADHVAERRGGSEGEALAQAHLWLRRAEIRQAEREAVAHERQLEEDALTRQRRWCTELCVALFFDQLNSSFYKQKGYILKLVTEIKASQAVGPFLARRVASFRKRMLNRNVIRARAIFWLIARPCAQVRRFQAADILIYFLANHKKGGADGKNEESQDFILSMKKYRRKIILMQRGIRRRYSMVRTRVSLLTPWFRDCETVLVGTRVTSKRASTMEEAPAFTADDMRQNLADALKYGTQDGGYALGQASSEVAPHSRNSIVNAKKDAKRGGLVLPSCVVHVALVNFVKKNMAESYSNRKEWLRECEENSVEIEATSFAGEVHEIMARRPATYSFCTTDLPELAKVTLDQYLDSPNGGIFKDVVFATHRRMRTYWVAWVETAETRLAALRERVRKEDKERKERAANERYTIMAGGAGKKGSKGSISGVAGSAPAHPKTQKTAGGAKTLAIPAGAAKTPSPVPRGSIALASVAEE